MFTRTKQEYVLTYYSATKFQDSLHFLLSAVIYLINISRGSYRPYDITQARLDKDISDSFLHFKLVYSAAIMQHCKPHYCIGGGQIHRHIIAMRSAKCYGSSA